MINVIHFQGRQNGNTEKHSEGVFKEKVTEMHRKDAKMHAECEFSEAPLGRSLQNLQGPQPRARSACRPMAVLCPSGVSAHLQPPVHPAAHFLPPPHMGFFLFPRRFLRSLWFLDWVSQKWSPVVCFAIVQIVQITYLCMTNKAVLDFPVLCQKNAHFQSFTHKVMTASSAKWHLTSLNVSHTLTR